MLDFVVKLQVLVCRPAAPRRTSARPAHKHAQSRRSADGPRCRGGCRTPGKRARVRHRHGIGLVRRGRDRVRGGAASNAVFGVDRLASWRADGATLHSVLEAGRRGLAAVFSPRKRHMLLLLELVFGHGRAAAASAAFVGPPARVSSRAGYSAHRLGSRTGREYRLTSPLHRPSRKSCFWVRSPIACMRSPRRLRGRLELKRGIEARNIGSLVLWTFGTSVLSKSTSSAPARRCGLRRSARHA